MDPETLESIYLSLQRYAGWLDRERAAVTVRADVEALGVAIATRADPTPLLQTLDADVARLPGSEVRKMLRAESAKLHRAVAQLQR